MPGSQIKPHENSYCDLSEGRWHPNKHTSLPYGQTYTKYIQKQKTYWIEVERPQVKYVGGGDLGSVLEEYDHTLHPLQLAGSHVKWSASAEEKGQWSGVPAEHWTMGAFWK